MFPPFVLTKQVYFFNLPEIFFAGKIIRMKEILTAALDYARSGLLVFPAPRGTKMSFKSARWSGGRRWGATRDELEIKMDWARWPDANVCIVTGMESKLFVTETDNKNDVNGELVLAALQLKFGALPDTRKARSPSGSIHYYWRYPGDGRVVKNDVGVKLGPGIDVRGDGGMVVAPPSERSDGKYIWLNENPVLNAPEWLLDKVTSWIIGERALAEKSEPVEISLVIAALAVIPTELHWHERNRVGMATWIATGGSQAGLRAWMNWLERSGRYHAGEAIRRWNGIKSSRPTNIGMGTLMHRANAANAVWLEEYDAKLADALNAAAWEEINEHHSV
jgi:hypothetical protein